MDEKILHDPKCLIPWEFSYYIILRSCRIFSISSMKPRNCSCFSGVPSGANFVHPPYEAPCPSSLRTWSNVWKVGLRRHCQKSGVPFLGLDPLNEDSRILKYFRGDQTCFCYTTESLWGPGPIEVPQSSGPWRDYCCPSPIEPYTVHRSITLNPEP